MTKAKQPEVSYKSSTPPISFLSDALAEHAICMIVEALVARPRSAGTMCSRCFH